MINNVSSSTNSSMKQLSSNADAGNATPSNVSQLSSPVNSNPFLGPEFQPSTDDLSRASKGQWLHVAGYPDNQLNGSMWYSHCHAVDWKYRSSYLWHNCSTREGNSGSPLWLYWPASGRRQLVAMHVGEVQVPKDSLSTSAGVNHPGAGAPGNGRKLNIARRSVNRFAAGHFKLGKHYSSLPVSHRSASSHAAGGSRIHSTLRVNGSSVLHFSSHTATPEPAVMSRAALHTSSFWRRSLLLAGNTGPAPDAPEPEHVKVPLAIPVQGAMYTWMQEVLNKHQC